MLLVMGLAHGKRVSEGQSRLDINPQLRTGTAHRGPHPPSSCVSQQTPVSVSQLSTLPPVRAGSALLPSADLGMDDHPMMDDLPHSLGPPRPACTQHSPVLSLTLLPCLQSQGGPGASTFPWCQGEDAVPAPCPLSLTGSVAVVGGGVESRFDVSGL